MKQFLAALALLCGAALAFGNAPSPIITAAAESPRVIGCGLCDRQGFTTQSEADAAIAERTALDRYWAQSQDCADQWPHGGHGYVACVGHARDGLSAATKH